MSLSKHKNHNYVIIQMVCLPSVSILVQIRHANYFFFFKKGNHILTRKKSIALPIQEKKVKKKKNPLFSRIPMQMCSSCDMKLTDV